MKLLTVSEEMYEKKSTSTMPLCHLITQRRKPGVGLKNKNKAGGTIQCKAKIYPPNFMMVTAVDFYKSFSPVSTDSRKQNILHTFFGNVGYYVKVAFKKMYLNVNLSPRFLLNICFEIVVMYTQWAVPSLPLILISMVI